MKYGRGRHSRIKVGDRWLMSDLTIGEVVRKRPHDHYDIVFKDRFTYAKVGVPALDISGDILRAGDAGFKTKLRVWPSYEESARRRVRKRARR